MAVARCDEHGPRLDLKTSFPHPAQGEARSSGKLRRRLLLKSRRSSVAFGCRAGTLQTRPAEISRRTVQRSRGQRLERNCLALSSLTELLLINSAELPLHAPGLLMSAAGEAWKIENQASSRGGERNPAQGELPSKLAYTVHPFLNDAKHDAPQTTRP